MSGFKSDFLNVLTERGFIHQCSDPQGLDALAAKGEAVAYVGYDCTAPSLHIGNFLTLMMLYWLQQTGNKPSRWSAAARPWSAIPPARTRPAPMRTLEEIEANKASIKLGLRQGADLRRRRRRTR